MKGGRGVTTSTSRAHHHEDHHMTGGAGGVAGWGLSWPPRFYTCNFCRREFRSAQALGGHMNVHRRDRARLRLQSPNPNPNLSLNLNPNPNNPTQPTLASPSTRLLSRYKHVGRPSSPQCAAIFEPKKLLVMRRQGKMSTAKSTTNSRERGVLKLGLEIGFFDHDDDEDDDDDDDDDDEDDDDEEEDLDTGLDLELRLGYSH